MENTKLIRKNDEIAKSFLSDERIAKDFLQLYLPPQILSRCDLSKLSIEPESYIDNDLKKRFCDVVYKLALLGESDCIYVHAIVEHQSIAEKLMPFRILRYTVDIIQKHINKYGDSIKLPLVVPLVIYNGTKSPYPYETEIGNLFNDKKLFDSVGLGNFKLIDLTVISDEELIKHKKLGLAEILLRHAYTRDFIKYLSIITKAFIGATSDNLGDHLFGCALAYIYNARECEEAQALTTELKSNLSNYEELIMTYAEHLRQEGMQKGMQKGMQQGRQEGVIQASLDIARSLLQAGVDKSIIKQTTHLTDEELKQLII